MNKKEQIKKLNEIANSHKSNLQKRIDSDIRVKGTVCNMTVRFLTSN